jgi:hypothetical protein
MGITLQEFPSHGRYSVWTGENDYKEANNLYEKWYRENIKIEHKHHWSPTDSHNTGTMFYGLLGTCGSGYGPYFFESMPFVPDKSIAISLGRKLALADPAERERLVECFGNDPMSPDIPKEDEEIARGTQPWAELIKWQNIPEVINKENFLRQYNIWLKYHPEWK